MTANTAQLAATLASLAALLADQEVPARPEPTTDARELPERILLTVEEVAERLRIGRTKAYELVKDGEIESVRIGRLRRVPKAAVDEYAAELLSGKTKA